MAGGESILVLEDNQSIRSFVRMVLAERGYQVIEARAGWQALKLAEASPPDVMLLDWQLPDITGLDVLRALRAGKIQAPAILMTAFGSEDLAMVALRLGVCDYLQKPFESDDLMRAIEGALAQIRLRREHAELVEQLKRLEHMAQSAAKAKSSLLKLARWMDELERGLPPEVRPRVSEAHRYIREIAEVFEGQPRPSG
jgi:DNA-binding response OmpR family regulator